MEYFDHNATQTAKRVGFPKQSNGTNNQMDIFPYLIDVLLTVIAAYWFVINTRRQSGSPTTGLFRYYETLITRG